MRIWFENVRGNTEDCELLEEDVDPYNIKGLNHIEENCASLSLLDKVPGYSFYEAGEL